MLKILFAILIVINGVLLSYQQGWLDALLPVSHEPTRLSAQLHPERLRLIVPETSPPVVDAAPATSSEVTTDVAPVPASTPSAPAANIAACLELGNFEMSEAQRFQPRLAGLGLGERLKRKLVQENVRHIVYIPPLGSREAADRKGAELRAMGIHDYFVIKDSSPLQWGISLGIFRTEESARNHLQTLVAQGVRSARVGTHGLSGNRIAFQLRGIDAATRQAIDHMLEDFPKLQWRDCS